VDKRRVKAVAERLAAAGIDPWVDQWEIQPGDDIVAKINDGLATYDVGLIFFSKVTLESAWVRGEVSTITYRAIEEGKAVIPVMLDADAPIPPLLRPRARVAGEDVEQLVEAIYGRRGKPKVAAPRAVVRERELRVVLGEAPDGAVQVRALLGRAAPGRTAAHPGGRGGARRGSLAQTRCSTTSTSCRPSWTPSTGPGSTATPR
jgi:hypothetical protein